MAQLLYGTVKNILRALKFALGRRHFGDHATGFFESAGKLHRFFAKLKPHDIGRGGRFAGRDQIEYMGKRVFCPLGPARAQLGGQLRLAFQNDAVFQNFQIVGGKRRAARGNVDDDFGKPRGGGAFRCAGAFDDTIVGKAVL